MNIILALLPLTLILVGVAIWAFFWAVGNGQFDDMDSPAYRILLDDDDAPSKRARNETAQPPSNPNETHDTAEPDAGNRDDATSAERDQ